MRILYHCKTKDSFIIKVNYSEGFAVTLPLLTGYNYHFKVQWGDGSYNWIYSATDTNRIHTYASGGTYTITMTGTLEGWTYTGMPAYLIEVTQWGRTGLKQLNFYSCNRLTACYGKLNYRPYSNSCSGVFDGCSNLVTVDISDWDVDEVTSFSELFRNCSKLTTVGDVSGWTLNNSANISLNNMFRGCAALTTLDVSNWNVSRVISLSSTFNGCSALTTLNVSNWNVSNVTSFDSTFAVCASLTALDVSNWNVTKATSFNAMFYLCSKLTIIDTSSWVFNSTSNINFAGVFYQCSELTSIGGTPDPGAWNTTKFTTVRGLFRYDNKLTTFNPSSWDVSNILDFSYFMDGCSSMTSLDLSNWVFNSSSYIQCNAMFNGCSNITTYGDLSSWNTAKIQSMSTMFSVNTKLTAIDVSAWDTTSLTDISSIFYYCSALTSLDMTNWDISRCKSINFYYCNNLTTIGDTSGWNTSALTSMSFDNCHKLTSLDMSGWDVSKITSFGWCFRSNSELTSVGDLSSWNVSNVTSFTNMFVSCGKLTSINCNGWNVSKATNFSSMFSGCHSLTSINVSGWSLNTTSNVIMSSMFNCQKLTSLSFTGWNTSKVTNFQQFLDGCYALATCDVSVLSTASATNVSYMFRSCRALSVIDISGWDMSLVTAANSTTYMFYDCRALLILNIPSTLSRVDHAFATMADTPALTDYYFYRAAAPTVSGTPFGNYAKPLHVPVSNSDYGVSPWTNTAIFSSVTADL